MLFLVIAIFSKGVKRYEYHHVFQAVVCVIVFSIQGDNEFEPVDNCITSVLGRHVELTEEFTRCYEVWLQREVLNTTIHWDLLLSTNTTSSGSVCAKCSAAGKKSSLSAGGGKNKTSRSTSNSSSEDHKKKAGGSGSGKSQACECNRRLVSDGSATEYTPLIQQLSGQQYLIAEQEEEDEYERKERMLTMIKKPSSANNSCSSATNGAIVDIPIDDDLTTTAATATTTDMELDKEDPEEQL